MNGGPFFNQNLKLSLRKKEVFITYISHELYATLKKYNSGLWKVGGLHRRMKCFAALLALLAAAPTLITLVHGHKDEENPDHTHGKLKNLRIYLKSS